MRVFVTVMMFKDREEKVLIDLEVQCFCNVASFILCTIT